MLCWSFCIIFLWTYICTCTFTVQYCFEWLQQETANTGKTKIGENAIKKKNSLFCSFVRKLFYSETVFFYIFTRTCTPNLWKYIYIYIYNNLFRDHSWNNYNALNILYLWYELNNSDYLKVSNLWTP